MKIYTTAPMEGPRDAAELFPRLEEIGYDGAFSFEAKLDPFLPLAFAVGHTTSLRLGTAIRAIFAGWEERATLDFRGEFCTHDLMTPAFDPGPFPFGPLPSSLAGSDR